MSYYGSGNGNDNGSRSGRGYDQRDEARHPYDYDDSLGKHRREGAYDPYKGSYRGTSSTIFSFTPLIPFRCLQGASTPMHFAVA